ncbi:hypothetical protein [Nostoc sp.]|uniref:hypothetical protein n=1 Tax=Nostoc sp. TaxID=1180 RepID=UPI002FF6F589
MEVALGTALLIFLICLLRNDTIYSIKILRDKKAIAWGESKQSAIALNRRTGI